jgi:aspartyl-tRNA synthetase
MVQKPGQAIEKATIKECEILVSKIYVVSAATALPFQIEDLMVDGYAMKREAEEREKAKSEKPEKTEEKKEKKEEKKDKKKEEKEKDIYVSEHIRLDNRTIDLRTPANHAIFRIQCAVGTFFRQYFLDKGFVEIHSPKITPGVSEGGASVFRFNYFGSKACLAQSPQLFKQMAVLSDLFKVFEIGPVFRAENSLTHRHLCEFTGLDFEMEIKEHYHEVLDVLSELFTYIFDKVNEKCKEELEAVNAQYKFTPLQYGKKALVISFPEAVKMLRGAGVTIGDFDDFSTPQEKLLGKLVKEQHKTDFYIVDRYPKAARPFYTMPDPKDSVNFFLSLSSFLSLSVLHLSFLCSFSSFFFRVDRTTPTLTMFSSAVKKSPLVLNVSTMLISSRNVLLNATFVRFPSSFFLSVIVVVITVSHLLVCFLFSSELPQGLFGLLQIRCLSSRWCWCRS